MLLPKEVAPPPETEGREAPVRTTVKVPSLPPAPGESIQGPVGWLLSKFLNYYRYYFYIEAISIHRAQVPKQTTNKSGD